LTINNVKVVVLCFSILFIILLFNVYNAVVFSKKINVIIQSPEMIEYITYTTKDNTLNKFDTQQLFYGIREILNWQFAYNQDKYKGENVQSIVYSLHLKSKEVITLEIIDIRSRSIVLLNFRNKKNQIYPVKRKIENVDIIEIIDQLFPSK